MRVLIVDDHALVRAGIRALVADIAEVGQILEAGDGREALAVVAQHRPDVVLMDISMPQMDGLKATSQIAESFPQTRVIVLSMHRTGDFVVRALKAGASGYVLKDASVAELEDALRTVAEGGTYISPAVREEIADAVDPIEQLTPRQREVLLLIAAGQTNRQIAESLHVHIKTVESHRTQLMKRLDIHDIAGLVRFAIRHGLIGAG